MKPLLLTTAVLEAGAGLALLGVPSRFAQLLFAAPLEGAIALTVARVGGMSLLTLAVAAWFASHDSQSCAARGLASAMVLYNLGVAVVLGVAGLQSAHVGIALWPVVLLHAGVAIWCVTQLLRTAHPAKPS